MPAPAATPITCPNCRQPFSAVIEQLIDVGRDPNGKARLLSGRLNVVTCPHCGFQAALSTPLAYHDASKGLLIIHVPLELGLPKTEQERVIGNFTNAVVNSLPQEQRKGYLFTPKMALTLQSMLDIVLESDGVTPEMMTAQRERVRLIETLIQADPETLSDVIKQNDAQIDMEFFDILEATTESAMAGRRQDVAERLMLLRERLLEESTVGQQAMSEAVGQQALIQEVASKLNGLGQKASHDDVVNAVLDLAQAGDDRLQIVVGLARPALDYEFFQTLTTRIDAANGADKPFLETTRDRLLELISMVDQRSEAIVKSATETLNGLLDAPDLDAEISANIERFDDSFMQVLSLNIQAAEQDGKNPALAERLKVIFDHILAVLQASAPPAVQFINQLMLLPTAAEAAKMINERAAEFGPELLGWFDMLSEDLAGRGGNPQMIDRLGLLRDEAERALARQPGMAAAPAESIAPPQPSPAPAPAANAPKIALLPGFDRPRRNR